MHLNIGTMIMCKALCDIKGIKAVETLERYDLSDGHLDYIDVFIYALTKITKYSRVHYLNKNMMYPSYAYTRNPSISITFKDNRIYQFNKLVNNIKNNPTSDSYALRIAEKAEQSAYEYIQVIGRHFVSNAIDIRTAADHICNRFYIVIPECMNSRLDDMLLVFINYLNFIESKIPELEEI